MFFLLSVWQPKKEVVEWMNWRLVGGGAANQRVEQMLTGRRTNRETDRWMGSQVDKQTALD